MDKNRAHGLKPVVVIRRKTGPKGSPATPIHAGPSSSPVTKTAAPATPAPPAPEVQHPTPQPSPAIPTSIETDPSQKEQEKQARRELLEILRDRWPQAFPRDSRQVRPLAIGIGKDIAAHLPEQPLRRISTTIGIFQHLTGPAYYRAVLQGGARYDLDGNPHGEVTLKEQEQARRALHTFFEQRKKQRGSSTPPPRGEGSAEGPGGARRED